MFDRLPLLRLLFLTAFVVIAGTFAFRLLNWMGSQQIYSSVDHPWMLAVPWQVARLSPDHCNSAGFEDLLDLGGDWVIWIDLQATLERKFKIVCPAKPFEMGGGASGPALDDVLDRLAAQKRLIFNIRAVDPHAAGLFLEQTKIFNDRKYEVGIASPSQSVLRTLRKLRPDWLYAADAATWTKLKAFSTMGIETAADLWPDFFVASTDAADPNFFSLSGAKEISRRKKLILLDWDGTTPIPEPWKQHFQGILTYRPKNLPPHTFFPEKSAH